jgi:hypothetical protein
MWTDESFKSGEAAAQRVLDRIAQPVDLVSVAKRKSETSFAAR